MVIVTIITICLSNVVCLLGILGTIIAKDMYVVRFFEHGAAGPVVGGPINTLTLAIELLKMMNLLITGSSIVDGTRLVFTRGGVDLGFVICEDFLCREIKTIEVEEK